MNLIDKENIEIEAYKKIPLSLVLNKNKNIQLTEKLEYLIKSNTIKQASNQISTKNTIDIKPNFSIYDDFEQLVTKKETIIEYIKNLFNINQGSYPFDPTFGYFFKKYIHMKDIETRKVLFNNEIRNVINDISDSFDSKIQIKNSRISETEFGAGIEYNVLLELIIDGQTVSVTM